MPNSSTNYRKYQCYGVAPNELLRNIIYNWHGAKFPFCLYRDM
jgi:hypothetical protein